MKIGVVFLCFFLLIAVVSAEESSSGTVCKDSDGGKNLFNKGLADNRVNGLGSWYDDTCLELVLEDKQNKVWKYKSVDSCSGTNCNLQEGFCDGKEVSNYAAKCDFGCKNGACLQKTSSEKDSQGTSESVTCVFKGATTEQRCYFAGSDGSTCSGKESCVLKVQGKSGDKMTWKSTCGGYAYTVTDGNNEEAVFTCLNAEVKSEEIGGRGFKYAYYQCYDGEVFKSEGDSSCKSSETWQKYAREFCDGHCYADNSKCGVNSFGVSGECYTDEALIVVVPASASSTAPSAVVPVQTKGQDSAASESALICKDSCALDGKCYPFGYRKGGKFCTDKGFFELQLEGAKTCENSFECSSNVCVSGECVSQSTINRFFSWFKNIFGTE